MSAGAIVPAGRAASMERRRALSLGKRALPPPAERVRTGFREAALPTVDARPASQPTSPSSAPSPSPAASSFTGTVPVAVGRRASMLRREALARGKTALLTNGAATSSAARPAAAPTSQPSKSAAIEILPPERGVNESCTSCRAIAKARRAKLVRFGRGSAEQSIGSNGHRLRYAPKVVAVMTDGEQRVTGIRIGHAARVTGVEAGLAKPISGAPYIGPDEGATTCGTPPKVGVARTEGGQIVSGTLVRSRVAITGDKAGGQIRITGQVDPRPDDDLTPRERVSGFGLAQFQRQADPHGHSVFATNLGRSARIVGSRSRDRERPIEVTEGGQPVTGTAVGRSPRVTGDEPGSCRALTGTQYLTPARAVLACDPEGAGDVATLPRPDPVTGGKGREALNLARPTGDRPRVRAGGTRHRDRARDLQPRHRHAPSRPDLGRPLVRAAHGRCDRPAARPQRPCPNHGRRAAERTRTGEGHRARRRSVRERHAPLRGPRAPRTER